MRLTLDTEADGAERTDVGKWISIDGPQIDTGQTQLDWSTDGADSYLALVVSDAEDTCQLTMRRDVWAHLWHLLGEELQKDGIE